MDIVDRPARRAGIATDTALAVGCAALLAVTALMLAASWGGDYWQFTTAAGGLVGAIALARRLHRAWTAVAGLAVAAIAVTVAAVADLPREPAPAMVLGLAVLVGSAIRTLPVPAAAAIAAAGLAVVAAVWLGGGWTAVAAYNSLGWLTAVAVGLALRRYDIRRRTGVEPGQPYFRPVRQEW